MKLVPKYASSRLRSFVRQWLGYGIIYNVNRIRESDFTKRAVLIYLVKPFRLRDDDRLFIAHQNLKQCKQIASLLGEFGYVVDVADVEDRTFRLWKAYDLIISHRVDFDFGENRHCGNATKIYLSSGTNHIVHNKAVRERYDNLTKRRRCRLEPYRLVSEVMPYVAAADAIAGFGNEFTMSKWTEMFQIPAHPFNNYGFYPTMAIGNSKDWSTTRRNFFFFASQDQVGRGLDLLLEIFPKHPELNLYICSSFENEQEFCKCYDQELYNTPNIHPIGWISVRSSQFDKLVETCAYAILPTCSEGQPGSVIQCMHAGLIPVVTKEAGISTGDFGITFTDDSIGEIERTIVNLSQLPENWHRDHSVRTKQVAEIEFSEAAFIKRWREILDDIISKKDYCHGVSDQS